MKLKRYKNKITLHHHHHHQIQGSNIDKIFNRPLWKVELLREIRVNPDIKVGMINLDKKLNIQL